MDMVSKQKVVFGLDGRIKEEIGWAIDLGYRMFDGADTYLSGEKNTYHYLAEALKEKKITDFQLIYKIDQKYTQEELIVQLTAMKELLGKPVEYLLIHNWVGKGDPLIGILQMMKSKSLAIKIGVGNFSAEAIQEITEIEESGKTFDCFEISAELLLDEKYLAAFQSPDKEIFVYNMRRICDTVFAPEVEETEFIRKAFLRYIKACIFTADKLIPIISSSCKEHMGKNLIWEFNESEEKLYKICEIRDKITAYITKAVWPAKAPEDVKGILTKLYTKISELDGENKKEVIEEDPEDAISIIVPFIDLHNYQKILQTYKEELIGKVDFKITLQEKVFNKFYTLENFFTDLTSATSCNQKSAFDFLGNFVAGLELVEVPTKE